MARTRRAKTVTEIYGRKRDILKFEGEWEDFVGQPEIRGSWIAYGHSGHGKTAFCTQFAKMLTQYGTVWYNGLEEGDGLSFETALKRVGMEAVGNRFLLIEDKFDALCKRLSRRNRPKFCFIDSSQKMRINTAQFEHLEDNFTDVQFIWVGRAEGKKPEGRIAKAIEYESYIKIWIEGFKAFAKSRYGGGQPLVIYPKRAAEYWGDIKLNEND